MREPSFDIPVRTGKRKPSRTTIAQLVGKQEFTFDFSTRSLTRSIHSENRQNATSAVMLPDGWAVDYDLQTIHDLAWLRSSALPAHDGRHGTVRLVDLFSGCGALSLGIWEVCRALQMRLEPVLAVDIDRTSIETYTRNFPAGEGYHGSVEDLLDNDVGQPLSERETLLCSRLGRIDVVVGGPPCQGHSNLNNRTRRNDPKNALYLKMARFAEVLAPTHIIIENVPDVLHDRNGVVGRTSDILQRQGYQVVSGIVDLAKLGVPQRRRRFVLIASKTAISPLSEMLSKYYVASERTVDWAIADLAEIRSDQLIDTPSRISSVNQSRADYLFQHDLYELPDAQRPDCHRLHPHNYPAVYGRMHGDEAAPTLTRGFGSPGQGRFVHPHFPRTLTPHEAARIQFIPDFFAFGNASRSHLQEMIGNAAPPKLSYLLGLELLA